MAYAAGGLVMPLAAFGLLASAPRTSAQIAVRLGAVLLPSQEVTPVAPGDAGGIGVGDLTIDASTGAVCVRYEVTGLSGPVVAAHIHSGGVAVSGPVLVTLSAGSGCVTTTPANAAAVVGAPGSHYLNVHTAASPDGAMRGQLTPTMFDVALTGPAEVPGPGDPDGTGIATVALDAANSRACVALRLNAVTLPATGAHIHTGAAGIAGPVVVPFTPPALAAAGSCGAAGASVVSAIAAAPTGHYVNIHNADFPSGAVRGQLTMRNAAVPTPPVASLTIPVGATVPATATTAAAETTVTTSPSTSSSTTSSTRPSAAAPTSPPTTLPATAPVVSAPQATADAAETVQDSPAFVG